MPDGTHFKLPSEAVIEPAAPFTQAIQKLSMAIRAQAKKGLPFEDIEASITRHFAENSPLMEAARRLYSVCEEYPGRNDKHAVAIGAFVEKASALGLELLPHADTPERIAVVENGMGEALNPSTELPAVQRVEHAATAGRRNLWAAAKERPMLAAALVGAAGAAAWGVAYGRSHVEKATATPERTKGTLNR